MTDLDAVFRLFLAVVLGAVIGIERETFHKPAGLRTHILVCVGSALFTLISLFLVIDKTLGQPAQIAAQIVSGIGFLGAGTIIREPSGVRGLTTAASLWATAGIGMAAGAGYYAGALAATLFVFLCLILLSRLGNRLHFIKPDRVLAARCANAAAVAKLPDILSTCGFDVKESSAGMEKDKLEMRLLVGVSSHSDYQKLMSGLLAIGVLDYEWKEPH